MAGHTLQEETRESEPKGTVLDIEKNTIDYRGVVWPVLGVTLPSSSLNNAVGAAAEWASPTQKRAYDWGLKALGTMKAKGKRIGKRIFADLVQLRFPGDRITDAGEGVLWSRLRKAVGWAGTRINKVEAISKDDCVALLKKCGLLP
jgi:hypothetical protein